jgi:hypothetical protein
VGKDSMGDGGIAVIWVISLRELTRRLWFVIKPIIVLLAIALILWWASGRLTDKQPDREQPLLHDEYVPFSHRLGQGPQLTHAALSFVQPNREGGGWQVTVMGSRNS